MMLSETQIKIIKELIRDPRQSDNQIAKKTGIPTMTVNRKRKELEEKKIINYFASVNLDSEELKANYARQLYVIRFKEGLTREMFLEQFKKEKLRAVINKGYVLESYIGESAGLLALVLILEAKSQKELVDLFNGKIIPDLKKSYGQHSIVKITTTRLNDPICIFRNYYPELNIEKGHIKKSWPDSMIYVADNDKEQ